jgi:polar amino acid transport system permease protein
MTILIDEFFNLGIMLQVLPLILRGLMQTLLLAVLIVPLGLGGGLFVATLTTQPRRAIRWPALVYVDLFRAFPPLVLLILVYSGLPFLGITLNNTAAIALAFLLHASSYYSEIYRAGIENVPKGQYEAGRSTGLSGSQTFILIVLPQAIRNVLPELLSNTVELIKLTSLASVISASELLHSADLARSITYNTSPLVLAALIYLVLLWPVVILIRRLSNSFEIEP